MTTLQDQAAAGDVSMGLPPSKEHSMREEQTLPEMPEIPAQCLMRGTGERFGATVKAYYTADQLRAYGLACFNAGIAEAQEEAAVTVARYKAGNTTLLEALMDMVHQHCDSPSTEVLQHGYLSSNEIAFEALLAAKMAVTVDGGIGLLWDALEERKPKRQTWEQAVNECVTDPVERARLLAFNDAPPAAMPNKDQK